MKRLMLGMLIGLLFLTGFGTLSFAGEETAGDIAGGMGRQIGRGLWNVVSSPAEIPCTMRDDIKQDGGIGTVTGLGKGLAFFVRRAVVGVCEFVTFVMPSEATIPPVCAQPEASASGGPGVA